MKQPLHTLLSSSTHSRTRHRNRAEYFFQHFFHQKTILTGVFIIVAKFKGDIKDFYSFWKIKSWKQLIIF
jgi:hypothetical protein